ncbi:MAG: hypothetical protein ACRC7B_02560 [Metamycoplasmataceae bacterium]
MKKILLGTGALALAVIPVAALVSCSSSTTLQKEADRFKKAVKTKTTGMNSSVAAGSIIYDTPTPAAKKAALEKLVDVPKLDSEYEFAVLGAKINTTTKTTIDVEIEVYSGANETEKVKVNFQVTGFEVPNTLAEEKTKWEEGGTSKQPTMTTELAVLAINDASGAIPKWQALHGLSSLPVRGAAFTYEVISAEVNPASTTAMIVTIKVTDSLTARAEETILFPVTGFTAS